MFIGLIVGFVYNMLKMFDIVPAITENQIMDVVSNVLTFLGLIGVLVDPTTKGVGDSKRALKYEEPWVDK
jgi:phi LC3 family holin